MADRTNPWRWHCAALAIYAATASYMLVGGGSLTRNILGYGTDSFAFIWFLAWWPWALSQHLDPFYTHLLWQPLGLSLLWLTSVPLLALLAMPLTVFAGPVFSYDILILLAPISSALLSYLLYLRITNDVIASLIGGFLFGFSSYEIAQDTAALNLSFTFCLPALLFVVLARLDDSITGKLFVLISSALLAIQFLISIEVFALIFVFGGLTWLIAFYYAQEHRPRLVRLFFDATFSVMFVLVLLAPCLISMFRHYGLVQLPQIWPYYFTADLLNVFIPSATNGFGSLFTSISRHFSIGLQARDAYLGFPLLYILWRFGREQGYLPHGRLLLALFLLFLVMSFGPSPWVMGHYVPVALPWTIFVHVPLLKNALPARFALFVSLVASLIAALWVASPGARSQRIIIGLLACITLAPAPHPWEPIPKSAFFAPGHVQAVLGPNPQLLILPFAINGPSSYWQQSDHFGFTQTGGYLGFPPAPMQKYPAVSQLFGNYTRPTFAADVAQFAIATGTQYVIIAPGTLPAMANALASLGWPRRVVDDVTILTVPGHE